MVLSNLISTMPLRNNHYDGTWENYLKVRWGYSPDWWVKLQAASKVVNHLKSNTIGIDLPTSERQARELTPGRGCK